MPLNKENKYRRFGISNNTYNVHFFPLNEQKDFLVKILVRFNGNDKN